MAALLSNQLMVKQNIVIILKVLIHTRFMFMHIHPQVTIQVLLKILIYMFKVKNLKLPGQKNSITTEQLILIFGLMKLVMVIGAGVMVNRNITLVV